MIERIVGQVVEQNKDNLVVMVGGVGLRVYITQSVLDIITDDAILLYTHLHIREDQWTLYGFETPDERKVFEALIKVNGVGAKLGIAILSTLTIARLRDAVAYEKPEVITHVPGVGKKTAQKIILELKDKIGWELDMDAIPLIDDVDEDVLASLTALGYSVVEAQSAIQSIPRDASKNVEERLRIALQYFA